MIAEQIVLVISSIFTLVLFVMSIVGFYIQIKNYRLQREEVNKQNNRMIELLEKIAGE